MAKRGLSMLLAIAALFSLGAPAFAEVAPAEEPIVTEEPVEVTEESVVTEKPVVTEEPVVVPEATEAPETIALEDEPMTVAETASGTCGGEGDGSNLTWTLSSDGVLTISGQGEMKDYGLL